MHPEFSPDGISRRTSYIYMYLFTFPNISYTGIFNNRFYLTVFKAIFVKIIILVFAAIG